MKKLRIGFVIDDGLDSTDGVQQYVLTLGHWLQDRGHKVHYLAGETKEKSSPNIYSMSRNLGVRFNGNSLSTPLPTSSRKIKMILNSVDFDVLHVQVPYSPFMAGRIISQARYKTAIIGTFHILPFGRTQRLAVYLLGLWMKLNLRHFDKMLAVSDPAKNLCRSAFKTEASVLPNVVDTKRFSVKNKKPSEGVFKIVFLGRLVERKGCQQLIKALGIIQREKLVDKQIRLIIGGTGKDEPALRQLVEANSLDSIVEFEGFIDESKKPQFLNSGDIAIFPSLGGESFGIVLIEAMAAGAGAVIGGDNPGYRSVLEPIEEALVDARGPAKIAEKLAEVINDDALRRRINKKQRNLVKQFDVNIVGEKLEKIYLELVKSKEVSQNN